MATRVVAVQRAQAILARKAFGAMFATSLADFAKHQDHPRRAEDALAGREPSANQAEKPRVLDGTSRMRASKPFADSTKNWELQSTQIVERRGLRLRRREPPDT